MQLIPQGPRTLLVGPNTILFMVLEPKNPIVWVLGPCSGMAVLCTKFR